ncbi:MAG: hypothetical protein AB7I41_10475 [Candidatus Sericytochromatia bacterium]
MTFSSLPDPSVRRAGYTNTPSVITPPPATTGTGSPAATPPAVSSEPPAQIATPSSFQGTPGVGQDAGFNPISADIFKKIQQADSLAAKTELTGAQMDPEMAAILQKFKEALAEISPPPDSQLSRIMGQFKAVIDKLAEKIETGQAATPAPSGESQPSPAAEPTAEPAASTPEAPAPADAAATEPGAPEATSEPAVAEALADAEAAEAETEIAAAEASETEASAEAGEGDTATSGTAPTPPESPKETDNPALKDPQEMLKGSIEELLAMFQKKRLEEQLSAFGEEQLQKMREALNQAAKVLRGMP